MTLAAMLLMATSSCVATAQETPNVEIKTYTYAIKGNDTLSVDIYLREDLKEAQNLPVMLYVHGGGFSMGSRKNAAQEIFIRHYAEQGYLGASIDYRLGSVEGNPYNCQSLTDIISLATTDMAEAMRYIIDNFPIDTKKVITSGSSAGACTVLQAEYDICNEAAYTKEILPEGFNYAGIISAAGAVYSYDNGPMTWKNAPCPVLFMQGSEDNMVPTEEVEMLGTKLYGIHQLHKSFADNNFPHWTYLEKGADHVVAMKHLTDNFEISDCFIRKFVDSKGTASVYTEWQDAEPASMADINLMIKYAPMYILGYDKYLSEIDWANMEAPTEVKY